MRLARVMPKPDSSSQHEAKTSQYKPPSYFFHSCHNLRAMKSMKAMKAMKGAKAPASPKGAASPKNTTKPAPKAASRRAGPAGRGRN